VRRLVAVYGAGWTIAVVLSLVMVLGLIDYRLRLQDRGLRVICLLVVLAVVGWSCYRFLYLPLFVRLRDVDLALKLQRRFPGMEDRLVSSVEFLQQSEDDPTTGSAALRRAVIAQTTARTERIDFSEVINARPTLCAAMASGAICLVAAILLVLDPVSSQIAVARLANPFGSTAWPRNNHLRLVERVERVGRGQAFEVEVEDTYGAKLPPDGRVHYRFENPDGSVAAEMDLMQPAGSRLAARRDNVVRPFSYRITGGDDRTMPWIAVRVVEPPAIESLLIRLIPPAYTGWPAERAEQNIRALIGTQMELVGKATKPLRSAELWFEGGRRFPARIESDGLRFSVGNNPAGERPVIERSGSYRLELTDREGLNGRGDEGGEVRAVADAPPTVTIERPAGNLFVTPKAVVPLTVAAKDDLAIARIDLVFRRPDKQNPASAAGEEDAGEEIILPLLTGPEKPDPQPAGALSGGAELGDRQVVESRWNLASLELAPGDQFPFHATASDYRPQTGAGEPRRLIVITPEQLQDRIAVAEQAILTKIAGILKSQRVNRAQLEAIEIRLAEIGRLEQLDLDHLQAVELNQRRLDRWLTSRSDSEGVPAHVLALLAELENNQLDSPDIERRMAGLLAEIDRLKRRHLTPLGRELTAAIKSAEVSPKEPPEPAEPDTELARSLENAGRHQEQVIDSLQRLLGGLSQWDNYRRFHREIGQLLRDQRELQQRSTEVGRRTLARNLEDLVPQDLADLKILAGRQTELARRLDCIQQAMDQAAGQLQQGDPLAAETLADALAETRRLAISGQMRTAGEQLHGNRIGQLAARQKQIVVDLEEVLDILANRRRQEFARLVKKLIQAETDLADIHQQQQRIQEEFSGTSRNPDATDRRLRLQRLAEKQQLLQQQTEQISRRLERLLAEQPARTTAIAAGQMDRAGRCAAQADSQGACRAADAAERLLRQARDQLAQRRRQAEAQLAGEQLARLEDTLKHVRRQQQNVLDDTRRYDELGRAAGGLSRAQAAGLQQTARLQRSLQTDTALLADKLAGAGVFRLALSGAAGEMGRAAAMLEGARTGPPAQTPQRHALSRIDLVLKAVEPEKTDGSSDSAGGGMMKGQAAPPRQGVQTLAELKLVKLLQQEINLRTAELQELLDSGVKLTEQQAAEFAFLAGQQGRLARLVLEMLQAAAEDPEDNPAELPEVWPENGNKTEHPDEESIEELRQFPLEDDLP